MPLDSTCIRTDRQPIPKDTHGLYQWIVLHKYHSQGVNEGLACDTVSISNQSFRLLFTQL
jgi:hypothetical protein